MDMEFGATRISKIVVILQPPLGPFCSLEIFSKEGSSKRGPCPEETAEHYMNGLVWSWKHNRSIVE
jgi:hypothetical protein